MTQMLECLDKLCVLEVGSTPALKLMWISGRQFIMHVHFKIFMLNIYTINIDIALVGKLASRLWSYPSVEHFLKKIRNDCWLFWFAILPPFRCQTTFHIQNAHILSFMIISPQVMFASPNTNISYYHYTGEGGDTAWLQHHRLRGRQEISLYAMVSSHWSRAGHVTS